jgi:hypothetical protein
VMSCVALGSNTPNFGNFAHRHGTGCATTTASRADPVGMLWWGGATLTQVRAVLAWVTGGFNYHGADVQDFAVNGSCQASITNTDDANADGGAVGTVREHIRYATAAATHPAYGKWTISSPHVDYTCMNQHVIPKPGVSLPSFGTSQFGATWPYNGYTEARVDITYALDVNSVPTGDVYIGNTTGMPQSCVGLAGSHPATSNFSVASDGIVEYVAV